MHPHLCVCVIDPWSAVVHIESHIKPCTEQALTQLLSFINVGARLFVHCRDCYNVCMCVGGGLTLLRHGPSSCRRLPCCFLDYALFCEVGTHFTVKAACVCVCVRVYMLLHISSAQPHAAHHSQGERTRDTTQQGPSTTTPTNLQLLRCPSFLALTALPLLLPCTLAGRRQLLKSLDCFLNLRSHGLS